MATTIDYKGSNVKNINEEINEIMSNKDFSRNKKIRLIAEKTSKFEAPILYNLWLRNNPEVAPYVFNYTMGIEIECGMNIANFERLCTERGINVYNQSHRYSHSDSSEHFTLASDGSVHADREQSVECISPILQGNTRGYAMLKKACEAIAESNGNVNKTCGLHIHIGCADMTDTQYVNVFKNYKALEAVIDTFMAQSRRANNAYYAQSIKGYNFDCCANPDNVLRLMRCNRYHKVNPCSWSRHKTIEFRQHQGSTSYEKISKWATFCAKLVEYSRCNVIGNVTCVDEIPFLTDSEKRFFNDRVNALN